MNEQTTYAYGFARMPRIIRKGYKNLTKMQKLLYIYLRDLAGEDGTCYRSLRTLQEETGFSIGYLSENIPILHNEGLIHAEMKKSATTHWEVWHISIVDIWELNASFIQAEKCSPDEQLVNQSVQDMNRSVHQMNSPAESVHAVNESVHAMTLNKKNTKNNSTENNDRKEREDSCDAASADITRAISPPSENDVQDDEETQKRAALQKTIAQDNQSKGPPAPSKPKLNTVTPVVPPKHRQDKPITMPTTDEEKAFQARCSRWYKQITEWCGGPMKKAGAVINEHKAIKALCELSSDKQIGDELEYLTTKDWKWSKIDNKYNVRAFVLLEHAGAVKRILDNPPVKGNGHASTPPTGGVFAEMGIKRVEVAQ